MDQIKIGKFIAEERKEQNLTQLDFLLCCSAVYSLCIRFTVRIIILAQ